MLITYYKRCRELFIRRISNWEKLPYRIHYDLHIQIFLETRISELSEFSCKIRSFPWLTVFCVTKERGQLWSESFRKFQSFCKEFSIFISFVEIEKIFFTQNYCFNINFNLFLRLEKKQWKIKRNLSIRSCFPIKNNNFY